MHVRIVCCACLRRGPTCGIAPADSCPTDGASGRRLRELQEVLPLTLSPPAGSSAPVSLAASLRLAQPQPSQPSVAAAVVAVAGGVVPARQWPLIAAGPRVAAIAGAAAAPVQNRPVVRINGLLVPDGLAPTVDDGQEAQVCCLLCHRQSLALYLGNKADVTTLRAADRRTSSGLTR